MVLIPSVIVSDSVFTAQCDLTVRVYGFSDTVEVLLAGTTEENFQEQDQVFEQRLSEILGLDVFVTGIVQRNDT